jgi:hypothetical protein
LPVIAASSPGMGFEGGGSSSNLWDGCFEASIGGGDEDSNDVAAWPPGSFVNSKQQGQEEL